MISLKKQKLALFVAGVISLKVGWEQWDTIKKLYSTLKTSPNVEEINGLLVEPGNVEELTEAQNSLLENGYNSKKLGEQALLDVKKYSWDTTAYSVFQVYQSMLSNVMKVKRASSY